MQENPTALEGILDIEPPIMPLLYALELNAPSIIFITLLIISALFATIFLLRHRYFSIRGKAHRRLKTLQNHFSVQSKQQLDTHHAIFELSHVLRDGLNLKQLSKLTHLPDRLKSNKTSWEEFITQLSIARYSPTDLTPEQVDALFENARFWLKSWPVIKND